ncbi:MAG: hypothetical protein Q9162_007099 [Coniocarpon cinnabarinum]
MQWSFHHSLITTLGLLPLILASNSLAAQRPGQYAVRVTIISYTTSVIPERELLENRGLDGLNGIASTMNAAVNATAITAAASALASATVEVADPYQPFERPISNGTTKSNSSSISSSSPVRDLSSSSAIAPPLINTSLSNTSAQHVSPSHQNSQPVLANTGASAGSLPVNPYQPKFKHATIPTAFPTVNSSNGTDGDVSSSFSVTSPKITAPVLSSLFSPLVKRDGLINGTTTGSGNIIIMTSPSVYLAIAGISATKFYNQAWQTGFGSVGSASVATTLISQRPEDLKSVEQHIFGYNGPWQSEVSMIVTDTPSDYPQYSNNLTGWNFTNVEKPYNLFNDQRPVPASDYFFRAVDNRIGPRDAEGNPVRTDWKLSYVSLANTIISNDYRAYIAVPSQLRAMDAAWADCVFALDGIYDPPVPITAATFATMTPADPVSDPRISAVPVSMVRSDGPISTTSPPSLDPSVSISNPLHNGSPDDPTTTFQSFHLASGQHSPTPVSNSLAQPQSRASNIKHITGAFGFNGGVAGGDDSGSKDRDTKAPLQPLKDPLTAVSDAVEAADPQSIVPQNSQSARRALQTGTTQAREPQVSASDAGTHQTGADTNQDPPQTAISPNSNAKIGNAPALLTANMESETLGFQTLGPLDAHSSNADLPSAAPQDPKPQNMQSAIITSQITAPRISDDFNTAPLQANVPIPNHPPLTASQVAVTDPSGATRSDAIALGDSTIVPGGAPATISGNIVSANAGGAINVDGTTNAPLIVATARPAQSSDDGAKSDQGMVSPPQAIISFRSSSITAIPTIATLPGGSVVPGAIALPSTTLLPGGPGVTLGGKAIHAGSNGELSVGGSLIPFAASSPDTTANLPELSGQLAHPVVDTTLPDGRHAMLIGTQTAIEGGVPITHNGSIVSLAPNGQVAASPISGGSATTRPLSLFTQIPLIHSGVVITVIPSSLMTATETTDANGNLEVVVGGSTILLAGTPITLGSQVFSLADASHVALSTVGHASDTILPVSALVPHVSASPATILGAHTSTPSGAFARVIGTTDANGHVGIQIGPQTVQLGGEPVTVGSNVFSLEDASHLVESPTAPGKVPITITLSSVTSFPNLSGFLESASASTITGKDGNATSIAQLTNGMTLTAGGKALQTSGHVMSLASDGALVIDGKTEEVWDVSAFRSAETRAKTRQGVSGALGMAVTDSSTSVSSINHAKQGFSQDYRTGRNDRSSATSIQSLNDADRDEWATIAESEQSSRKTHGRGEVSATSATLSKPAQSTVGATTTRERSRATRSIMAEFRCAVLLVLGFFTF